MSNVYAEQKVFTDAVDRMLTQLIRPDHNARVDVRFSNRNEGRGCTHASLHLCATITHGFNTPEPLFREKDKFEVYLRKYLNAHIQQVLEWIVKESAQEQEKYRKDRIAWLQSELETTKKGG